MLQDFFTKYDITPESLIIIACSWWPDSIYLLSQVAEIHPKQRIVVAHFNHSLRGSESNGDETFLSLYCQEQWFVYEVAKKDIAAIAQMAKKWIEETARIERYSFLEEVRKKYDAPYILTAHHQDDSIETLMFHLIRGTKIQGLTGIPEKNGSILRPLLTLSKKEILKVLDADEIPYRIDSTNTDDTFLRNHLRLNVISEFERINPEYRKNIGSFMRYAGELSEYIDSQVEIFLRGETSFLVEDFQVLSVFLQREVIRYIYARANNGTIGLSEWNIAEIIRFIRDKGNYTEKKLGKLNLEKKNGRVYIIDYH